jgi:hypothetical protein
MERVVGVCRLVWLNDFEQITMASRSIVVSAREGHRIFPKGAAVLKEIGGGVPIAEGGSLRFAAVEKQIAVVQTVRAHEKRSDDLLRLLEPSQQ